ncbi:MAG: D-cysteine desulfhydrase family protein [Deltaproteobacteria bacterium]|nr:D-cysteine desulfhydrase family protein [Deltaproteobacteria bacterium]
MPPLPPRRSLAALPTPLHPLARLSAELGLELHVKRDDLTGSQLGGNKIRKLEYLFAAALEAGATHVLTCGGAQSNHARATALAARPLGLEPILLLRTPRGLPEDLPSPPTANVLLDRIAGARIVTCSPDDYRARRGALLEALADDVRASGGRPWIIPEGGSNALGALGYVDCAAEIVTQLGAPPDTVVVATGSGGTLAGLAAGFERLAVPTRALGVAVCDDRPTFRAIVDRIAAELADAHGLPGLAADRYDVLEGFQGEGYARATADELRFLVSIAREDGLVLDPVYTNKALLGLVTTARRDPGVLGRRVVFIHTGGIFGLFPYAEALTAIA